MPPSSVIRLMMTDGNNVHAPDYHAEITAEKIIGELESSVISISDTASPDTIRASRSLRKAIEELLTSHHQVVHDHEQAKLAEHGMARAAEAVAADASQEILPDAAAESVLYDRIADAAKGTPFAQMFFRDDVRTAVINELHHETRSQMGVHRAVFHRADQLAKQPRIVK